MFNEIGQGALVHSTLTIGGSPGFSVSRVPVPKKKKGSMHVNTLVKHLVHIYPVKLFQK